jgi:O-antigen/teichoic acid export membrane protein
VSALRRLMSRTLVRAGIVTYAFASLTLVANLVTGIVVARALGPEGRGVTIALSTVAQLAGFVFAMGAAQSLSYYIARRPADAPSLLTTWTLMLLPFAAVAIAITELLLPTIFASEPEAVEIGRWFMFIIVLVVGLELNYGLLLGTHDYFAYNALRFAPTALAAASLIALWALDELTVRSALIAPNVAYLLALLVGMGRSVRRIGIGPPAWRLGLTSLWYGVRGQGATVASNVTARLDVAMLPAYVSSASVGLYSVATNVSLIVYQLSNTFAGLVLPAAAAGERERGRLKVVGSLWASLAVAGVLAAVLGLLAAPLLELVYGSDFRDAAEPLVLLLPGAVLFAGASIVAAGVYAEGYPFTATAAQLVGMGVTVVGLFVFLGSGGTTAAALVSSGSYATVFVAMLLAYKHVTKMPWRDFLPTPSRLRALVR